MFQFGGMVEGVTEYKYFEIPSHENLYETDVQSIQPNLRINLPIDRTARNQYSSSTTHGMVIIEMCGFELVIHIQFLQILLHIPTFSQSFRFNQSNKSKELELE